RAQDDDRRRRRHGGRLHAHSPPRVRPCGAGRLSAAPAAPLAGALRPLIAALPAILPAESGEPPLRLSSAALVRAEPSRRGLCRNVRGVADAALELAQALCRMAGTQEIGICRRADGGDRGAEAAGHAPAARRAAEPADANAGRALREEADASFHRLSEDLRPRSSPHLLRRSEAP